MVTLHAMHEQFEIGRNVWTLAWNYDTGRNEPRVLGEVTEIRSDGTLVVHDGYRFKPGSDPVFASEEAARAALPNYPEPLGPQIRERTR